MSTAVATEQPALDRRALRMLCILIDGKGATIPPGVVDGSTRVPWDGWLEDARLLAIEPGTITAHLLVRTPGASETVTLSAGAPLTVARADAEPDPAALDAWSRSLAAGSELSVSIEQATISRAVLVLLVTV